MLFAGRLYVGVDCTKFGDILAVGDIIAVLNGDVCSADRDFIQSKMIIVRTDKKIGARGYEDKEWGRLRG